MKKTALTLLTLISSLSLCLSEEVATSSLEYTDNHVTYSYKGTPIPIALHIVKGDIIPNAEITIPMDEVVDALKTFDPNTLKETGNELVFLSLYTLAISYACIYHYQSIAIHPTISDKSLQKELLEAVYTYFNYAKSYNDIPDLQTICSLQNVYLVFDEQEDFDVAVQLLEKKI